MKNSGFTLIEMSIVLVVIGLVVGSILVGQDLISTSAQSAQISQISRYNTAVIQFQGKYNGYLPGDIPDPAASQFGFLARGQYVGEGDGDGEIAANNGNCAGCIRPSGCAGEVGVFWIDLATAGLIEGNFTGATSTSTTCNASTASTIANFLPAAKIGNGNFVYVWTDDNNTRTNFFGLSAVTQISYNTMHSAKTLTVQQAYNIDKKIDDGFPTTGQVIACDINSGFYYWTETPTWATCYTSTWTAHAGSSTTCMDNGNVNGGTVQYSLTQNNGNGQNCALSFQFQSAH